IELSKPSDNLRSIAVAQSKSFPMKKVTELNFGFNDAENYRRRENKELFNQIFIRTNALDKLCSNESFFLIGEKRTGKTAYSVYLANNNYRDTRARINYIRETEYQ